MSNEMRRAHTKKDRATAYHEAGHAVVAYIYRIGITAVSIIPDDTSFGRCLTRKIGKGFQPDIHMDRRTASRIDAHAMCMLAGGIAEHTITGKWNH